MAMQLPLYKYTPIPPASGDPMHVDRHWQAAALTSFEVSGDHASHAGFMIRLREFQDKHELTESALGDLLQLFRIFLPEDNCVPSSVGEDERWWRDVQVRMCVCQTVMRAACTHACSQIRSDRQTPT